MSAGKLCNTTRADVGSHTPPVAYLCNGEDKVQFGQSPICQQNVCETSEEESPKLSLSFAEIPSQIPAWTEGKIEVTNTGNVSLKKGHALAILKVGVSQEPTYINFPFTGSPDVPRKGSSGTSFVLKSPGTYYVYAVDLATGEPFSERKTIEATEPAAPVLSATSWNVDDPNTWPVMSVPSLPPSQKLLAKLDDNTWLDFGGSRDGGMFGGENGKNNVKLEASPAPGTYTATLILLNVYGGFEVIAQRPVMITVTKGAAPASQPSAPAATPAVTPAPATAPVQNPAPASLATTTPAAAPAPAPVIPASVTLSYDAKDTVTVGTSISFSSVASGSNLSKHGLEMSADNGANWSLVTTWMPQSGDRQSSNVLFSQLGTYKVRAYASGDGSNFVYSNVAAIAVGEPVVERVEAPVLSSAVWFADDQATWPVVSTPTVLTASQSIRVKDPVTGEHYYTQANGVNSRKITSSPSAGVRTLEAYVYDYARGAVVATRPIDVTVSLKQPAAQPQPATTSVVAPQTQATAQTQAQGAQTNLNQVQNQAPTIVVPAAAEAPLLSTTTWYSDDPSTWPTVSTPSALTANQSIRLKSSTGDQFFDRADGVNSGKITRSPAPGTYQVEAYVYDYSKSATVAVQAYTVTVSAKSIVQPAAQATASAQSTPVSTPSAPKLSSTSWYSDDQSTWPTISTPSTLTSSQSMRFKSSTGDQFFDRADGVNSGKITRSPAPGTYQVEAYVYDYSKSATVAVQAYTVTVSTKPVVVIPPPSVTVLAPSNTVTQGSSMQIWSTLSGANAIRHGLERSTGSGDWSNIASWNPQNGVQQGGSIPFPNLGTYQIRAYASNDAVNYVYSNPITVTVQPQTLTAPQLTKTTWYANDQSSWPSLFTPSTLSSGQSMRLKSLTGEQFFDRADGASFRKISRSPAPGSYQMEAYIYDYSKSATVVVRSISVTVLDAPAPSSDPASADQTNAAAGSNSASVMFSGDALQKLIRALQ